VDQPGVVACLGRTRTLVRIQPSRFRALKIMGTGTSDPPSAEKPVPIILAAFNYWRCNQDLIMSQR
jgi:hypothetical protein